MFYSVSLYSDEYPMITMKSDARNMADMVKRSERSVLVFLW